MMTILWILALMGVLTGCGQGAKTLYGTGRGEEPFSFVTDTSEQTVRYVLGVSTRKIHLPSCTYVARIAPKNRVYVDSLTQALAEQYVACSHCHPLSNNTEAENEERAK